MDKLLLKGMEFYGYHGLMPEEKVLGQKFIIDLELSMDLSPAGNSDDCHDTVNYAEVFKKVEQIITGQKINLLEALAEAIASRILQDYSRVEEVGVRVIKPHAPVPGTFKFMAAEIKRKK